MSTGYNWGGCHPCGETGFEPESRAGTDGSSAAAAGTSAGEPDRKRSHEQPGAETAGTEQSEDPWWRRCPGGGEWRPTPGFLSEISDRGAWRATVHGPQSRAQLMPCTHSEDGPGSLAWRWSREPTPPPQKLKCPDYELIRSVTFSC